ncbi:MAG: hypothetical protein U0Q22_08550 [Acidimicrobiales bacterium]
MSATALDALATTRSALHTLAEHVLAPDLHRSTGKIGLRRTAGGVGQPEHLVDGVRRRVRVDGDRLAVTDGDTETWHPLSTLGAAADAVGVTLGAGTGAYEPSTPSAADTSIAVSAEAAASLSEWFDLVDAALERFRSGRSELSPTVVQLWPEHFDLATSMVEINFGGSPGDEGRPEPYLYVGPWTPRVGDFWNEPYGAAIGRSEVASIDDAVEFFERGLAQATRR